MKRVLLALDVGDARIGLAIGERGSSFAFGRGFIERSHLQKDIEGLQQLYRQEKAEYMVIGLPKSKNGTDSIQTQKVRSLAKALENAGLNVILEDERFTTRLATQRLQTLPKHKRQEKGRLDEASAIVILESHLAKLLNDSA